MQLPLAIDPESKPHGRLPARIRPMEATPAAGPFDDDEYLFEPWWPGWRAIAFIEAGRVRLQTEQLNDLLESFPEFSELGALPHDAVILDGTILVLDHRGRPDSDLLRRRLHEPGLIAGRPAFLAADMLHMGDRSLLSRPYGERRERLHALLRGGDSWIPSRGYRGEGRTVGEAMAEMGMEAISARKLSARYRSGPAGDAWLRLPLVDTRHPGQRPSLSVIEKLPL